MSSGTSERESRDARADGFRRVQSHPGRHERRSNRRPLGRHETQTPAQGVLDRQKDGRFALRPNVTVHALAVVACLCPPRRVLALAQVQV